MVKNILGILLLVLVLVMSILGRSDEMAAVVPEHEVATNEEEEEMFGHGGVLVEYTRDDTVVPIEGFEMVDAYLDPHEKQRYEDLLTVYSSYLPLCASYNPQVFFDANSSNIGRYLGVYHADEFAEINQRMLENKIGKESNVDRIRMLDLQQNGRLLNAHIRIYYGEATIDMSHRLDYLYIGNQAYLFLYSNGGVTHE